MRPSIKAVLLFFSTLLLAHCNPVEHIQGSKDISYLKREKKLAFEMKYTDTKIGDKEEAEFKKEMIEKKNEEEAGKGDKWAEEWEKDKENEFIHSFKVQFNDYLLDSDTDISLAGNDEEAKNAKYKIVVNVTRMVPGYYGGVVGQDAKVDTRLELIEKGKDRPPMVVLQTNDVISMGSHATTEDRLKSAFEASAMHYGRWFRDELSE